MNCNTCKYEEFEPEEYPCLLCEKFSKWEKEERCTWELVFDGDFKDWHTECGEVFTLDSVPPTENGFKFCPYCGKRLEEIK